MTSPPTSCRDASSAQSQLASGTAIGSAIDASSFSSLLTDVEIGHTRTGSAGNDRISSCGSRSSLGASRRRENKRHSIVDLGHQFVEHRCDNRESTNPFAGGRVFPVFLQPAEAKRTAVLHGNRVELLSFLALNQMSLTKVSPLLHSSSHSWSVLFPCLDPGHEPLQYLVRLNIIPSQIS